MELGQRLKQARLEAGLSQRQLCGDTITRNMLSQIENGSARPSMDTLQSLAARLGKPIGYFLEEDAVISVNQPLMEQARAAAPGAVLEILKAYRAPDDVFDRERWLLEALACLTLAEEAIREQRPGYATSLLRQAAAAGQQTPYYTPELEQRRVLLCHRAGTAPAAELSALLPNSDAILLLQAEAALSAGSFRRCGALLDAVQTPDRRWHFLRGETFLGEKDYARAAAHYRLAEKNNQTFARLEQCYRELEDYKLAYEYACKQR